MKKRHQKGSMLMPVIVLVGAIVVIIYSYNFLTQNTSFFNQFKSSEKPEQNLQKQPNISYSLKIDSPKAGDRLYVGSVCEINWTSQKINAVSFYLAREGSSDVAEIIIEKIQASTGKFFWTIPTNNRDINLGGQFKIFAISEEISNSPISETGWFTITPNKITD